MISNQIWPSKATEEEVPLTFNFSARLQFGEHLTAATVYAYTSSGLDPTPENIISGMCTVSGPLATQVVVAGLPGVTYYIVCIAVSSGAHKYSLGGYLSVLSPDAVM